MKLVSAILSAALVMSWPSIGKSKESGDIIDFLPAIIAASTLTCDLDKLSTCKTKLICTRSEGYWYSNKCNLNPKGLVLIRRLAGTWDFNHRYSTNNEYISHDVIRFSTDTIKPIGSKGDYEIKGMDITYRFGNRNITATYRAVDDIVYVIFAKGSVSISGKELTLFPEYWYLDFVSNRELAGFWANVSILIKPENPAWATKR